MEVSIAGHPGTFAMQRRGASTELPLPLPWDLGHTDILEDLRRAAEMMRKAHREALPELPEWEGPVTPSDYRRAAKIMARCFEERVEPTPELLHLILTTRTAEQYRAAFGSEPAPEIFQEVPAGFHGKGIFELTEDANREILAALLGAPEDVNSSNDRTGDT
jgi:hypothetical protein